MSDELSKSADIVISQCMGVKKGELVLVIHDETTEELAESLFNAAERKTHAVKIKIQLTERDGSEPPAVVAKTMKESDVVIALTKYSLSHTDARRKASKKGARIVTMPGITREMFTDYINVDYEKMSENIKKLEKKFSKAKKVRVTSVSGTDITMEVKGRGRDLDTGLYLKKGEFGNLPAGEICLAPVEKTSNGTIVIDSMADLCNPKTRVLVRKGLVQEIEGDGSFRKKIFSIKNARNIAELGIGVNPKARITGNVLGDEKVLGTCHIAFGDNKSYDGGRVKADVHWDGIIIAPTIWFDSEKIMDNGELLL